MRAAPRVTWLIGAALFLLPSQCLPAYGMDDLTTVRGVLARRLVRSPLGPETVRNKATLAIYTLRLNSPHVGSQPWGKPGSASHRYRELQVICNTHYVADCDAILRRNNGRTVSMTGAITAAVEPNEVLPMVIEPSSIQEGSARNTE